MWANSCWENHDARGRVTEMSPIDCKWRFVFLLQNPTEYLLFKLASWCLEHQSRIIWKIGTLDPRLPEGRGVKPFWNESGNIKSHQPGTSAAEERSLAPQSYKKPQSYKQSSYLKVLAPSLRLDYNWEEKLGKVSGLVPWVRKAGHLPVSSWKTLSSQRAKGGWLQ